MDPAEKKLLEVHPDPFSVFRLSSESKLSMANLLWFGVNVQFPGIARTRSVSRADISRVYFKIAPAGQRHLHCMLEIANGITTSVTVGRVTYAEL
jgi:hypothetical protein